MWRLQAGCSPGQGPTRCHSRLSKASSNSLFSKRDSNQFWPKLGSRSRAKSRLRSRSRSRSRWRSRTRIWTHLPDAVYEKRGNDDFKSTAEHYNLPEDEYRWKFITKYFFCQTVTINWLIIDKIGCFSWGWRWQRFVTSLLTLWSLTPARLLFWFWLHLAL